MHEYIIVPYSHPAGYEHNIPADHNERETNTVKYKLLLKEMLSVYFKTALFIFYVIM